ncbi:predicted protein [Naegleria gruberi]|uniref:glycerol-3-phosphate dehydrogenase n=1 Tax=Naegleria gruberi TaxID=5762 RepID=D2V1L1_NAEGR|nr:uncharacterized protein NAEGRDRAFT_45914 [Naegleria gruberi]EFC49329.1 predicted protein [Naegleria gruberi]|eukprot:XP_002682073.1 predicted protein [Naegleria gruberi strain NEG-M]
MFRFGRKIFSKPSFSSKTLGKCLLIGGGTFLIGKAFSHSYGHESIQKVIDDLHQAVVAKPWMIQAFSVDDLPSADYTTFPFRTAIWKIPSREEQFKIVENLDEDFDLCIVGDGLIGASLAYEASMRGYSVCLLSSNDFVSQRDDLALNSNLIFHNVLEGDELKGLLPNFFQTQVMKCSGGFENDVIECKHYENLYNSMKDKLEKRNHLFSIAPHLMREYRNSEIFRNSQKFKYYKQMWKLLGYEYFVYGKDLWMEDTILDDRNYCEARLGVLRNRFQERTKDESDLFRDLKDARNVFRCITYYDSGILNLSRFISSLALTSAASGNIALNHVNVKSVDMDKSLLTFSDKIINEKEYSIKYKKVIFCENTSEDEQLLKRLNPHKCKEEYLFTLPQLSNYNIITQYGKFISHYRYSLLSLPAQQLENLKGILRLGDFTKNDIYSSSRFVFDNELKLISLKYENALRIIDKTKDYYSSHAVLKYIYGKDLKEMKNTEPIYGSENFVHFLTQTMKSKYPYLPNDIIRYLKFSYGDRCLDVLSQDVKQVADKQIFRHQQVWEDLPFIESEIKYLVKHENCIKALDVAIRCQMYKYDPLRIALEPEKLLDIMKDDLKWDDIKYSQEKQELIQFLNGYTRE